jgi:hypothetical protein
MEEHAEPRRGDPRTCRRPADLHVVCGLGSATCRRLCPRSARFSRPATTVPSYGT